MKKATKASALEIGAAGADGQTTGDRFFGRPLRKLEFRTHALRMRPGLCFFDHRMDPPRCSWDAADYRGAGDGQSPPSLQKPRVGQSACGRRGPSALRGFPGAHALANECEECRSWWSSWGRAGELPIRSPGDPRQNRRTGSFGARGKVPPRQPWKSSLVSCKHSPADAVDDS
jgi:hypothetical protein